MLCGRVGSGPSLLVAKKRRGVVVFPVVVLCRFILWYVFAEVKYQRSLELYYYEHFKRIDPLP